MKRKKLPKKLPVNPFPIGSYEWDVRRKAVEYNNLPESDTKRETVYNEWKEANLRALMD